MDTFFRATETVMPALRTKFGDCHAQTLSDVERARRAWADSFRRDLVLRLRGRLVSVGFVS